MKILSAAEMREVDQLTTEHYSIPSLTLMENAGAAVAAYVARRVELLPAANILVICGKGNNGGDGLVAARHLLKRGASIYVALLASYDQVQGDAKANLDALIHNGVRPHSFTTLEQWIEFASAVPYPYLVIDAILGTGLDKPVEGFLAQVIEDINARFQSAEVVAIDLPSGLSADSHEVLGPVVRSHTTLTMTAPKLCLAFPPAAEWAGDVEVISIGSPDSLVAEKARQKLAWLTPSDCRFVVEPRPVSSNKGAYGHALVIAGSIGKTGAAILTGRAALRVGAGLVTVATASSAQPLVAQGMPELMTIPLPETSIGSIDPTSFDYEVSDHAVQGKTVLAIGPGLSTHPETQEFVRRAVGRYRLPTILDADALNAFVDHGDELDGRGRVLVLTPHPGEFARLIKSTAAVVQSARKDFAREFATRHHVFLVLKGFRSLVATPDGEIFVCPTGNPGMAKGGTGDALTGILTGLLSQFSKTDPAQVVSAGVVLHGLAGDRARRQIGELSMLASDLIEQVPQVLRELSSEDPAVPPAFKPVL